MMAPPRKRNLIGGPDRVVWILNHYAQVPEGAGGTRHFSLAKNLRDHGWSAWIIAAGTHHFGNDESSAQRAPRVTEYHGGIPFVWLKTPSYSGNGLGRVVNIATYALRASRPDWATSAPRPDVIIGSSVHPLAGLAASHLASQLHVPFVFEVRDLWPETLIAFGRIGRRSMPAMALRALEKHLYKKAAMVISVLPKASDYISGLGVDAAKVVWIPNGIETDLFDPSPPKPIGDSFDVMYFGAHGEANALGTLLHAAKLIEDSRNPIRIRFRLIGSGNQKPKLRQQAADLGLTSVAFETRCPRGASPGSPQMPTLS
jgi:glycosyltransferase involved in cell wall biosynthesis